MSSNQSINVLLVAGRDNITDWLMTVLRSEAGVMLAGLAPSLERAVEHVEQKGVDVVLLDAAVADAKQIERLQAISAQPLSPALVLMVNPDEMAFVQQAMLAGARGFLLKPFTEAEFMESLQRACQMVRQQRAALATTVIDDAPQDESAQISVIFSPKGGVGRTSLATSLSVALHQTGHQDVTLIDGDLRFGDVDIAMNAVARKSIADILPYVDELEPALIKSALVDHSSGIRLLLAPPYFDPTLEGDDGRLSHIIKMMALAQSGHVVVDAPSGLDESTLNLLDVAQKVLLVTAPSVAALRATKRFLELAAKMDYSSDKILLVLNGYRKGTDIPLEDIERHLGHTIEATIPHESMAVAAALNQGTPITMCNRNHAVSKAIFNLAKSLGEQPDNEPAQKVETSHIPTPTSQSNGRASASVMRLLKPSPAFGR